MGREPGRGRCGATRLGAGAGLTRFGVVVVFGAGGFSEGASVSTRNRMVGGTTRPVGVTRVWAAGPGSVSRAPGTGAGAIGASGTGGVAIDGAGAGGAATDGVDTGAPATDAAATGGAGTEGAATEGVETGGSETSMAAGGAAGAIGSETAAGSATIGRAGGCCAVVGAEGCSGAGVVSVAAGGVIGADSGTAWASSSATGGGTILGDLTKRGGPSRGRSAGSGCLVLFPPFQPLPVKYDF